MNNIIKTLETIGQSISMQQFASLDEMKKQMGIEKNILSQIEKIQSDLICAQDSEDED